MGKNKYILQKMKSAFIVSFTIVFVGLGLNLILSQIVFNGGTNTPFDAEPLKYNSFVMVKTFLSCIDIANAAPIIPKTPANIAVIRM